MAGQITRGYKALVEEANAAIETLSAEEAIVAARDPGVLLVDIRDVRELKREGRVPGAIHAPRGMLEFWVDPESPYFREVFGEDRKFVFFCAGGLRSALATKTVQDMGMSPVAHIAGGFGAWKAAGWPGGGAGGQRGLRRRASGVDFRRSALRATALGALVEAWSHTGAGPLEHHLGASFSHPMARWKGGRQTVPVPCRTPRA